MSTFHNYYVVNLFVNEEKQELDTSNISFSIVDSIYNLYSYCILELNDATGFFQEGLLTTHGSTFKVEFGDKDVLNSCSYVIQKDNLEEVLDPGYLSGNVIVYGEHKWKNQQTAISKGYKDRISRIIKDLADKYNFSSVEVNDTGNEDYWYQLFKTDARFIEEMLLPNAFSRDAKNTPYYCFTTTNNEFHFRHYYSMSTKDIVAEIEYTPNPGINDSKGEVSQYNQTTLLRRWTLDPKNYWYLRQRHLFKIKREDGTLDEDDDSVTNYPEKSNLDYPIVDSDQIEYTSARFFQFDETKTGRQENLTGQKINDQKEGLLQDKFLLMLPMNPKIHAGKIINLRIYTKNNDADSKRFSGKYLVENCEHIWNADDQRAYTKLIVGRKYIQIPSAYAFKGKLIS
jgi:hypothetical protein